MYTLLTIKERKLLQRKTRIISELALMQLIISIHYEGKGGGTKKCNLYEQTYAIWDENIYMLERYSGYATGKHKAAFPCNMSTLSAKQLSRHPTLQIQNM